MSRHTVAIKSSWRRSWGAAVKTFAQGRQAILGRILIIVVFAGLIGTAASVSWSDPGAPDVAVALAGLGCDDADCDGIPDALDNCVNAPNVLQRDTDLDGIGNYCDADLNNDCVINVVDLGIMKSVFGVSDPHSDLDGDGVVNKVDLDILRASFFLAPGPSGLPNACAPAPQDPQSMYPGWRPKVGGGPNSVAIGDLNADGVPDVVTANVDSNDVSVLLRRDDGRFQPAQAFAAGDEPHSVVIGDLNADGVPDLVTADRYSHAVSVLLGQGDGSFEAAQSFAAGVRPESVAIGDLNADEAPDLVTANSSSDDVSVLLHR